MGTPAPALARTIALPGGERICVRPIEPRDAAIEQDFVRCLLPESRYNRFMGQVGELAPSMLARFTHNDYPRTFALIATVGEGGAEKEIGVARYASEAGEKDCEFAVTVADAWQGRGVGFLLMRSLMGIARQAGLERMNGYVLATNRSMLALARSLGFHEQASDEGPQVKKVTRRLEETV